MSDNIHSEPAVAAVVAKVATFVPGFAGAVLSLAFVDKLTMRGRVLAVIVGMSAAMWIAPALADIADVFWPGDMPRTVRAAVLFLTGLCAMGCLPELLKAFKRVAGDPFGLIKVRFGGGANEVQP